MNNREDYVNIIDPDHKFDIIYERTFEVDGSRVYWVEYERMYGTPDSDRAPDAERVTREVTELQFSPTGEPSDGILENAFLAHIKSKAAESPFYRWGFYDAEGDGLVPLESVNPA